MNLSIDVAIVGAQRSGTTSLATALGEHPQICLALHKETHVFDRVDVQRGGPCDDLLQTFYPHRLPGQLLLDATPSYLYLPGCIGALVRHSPEVRLIVILRDPAARALSHHAHSRSRGSENRGAVPALLLERLRLGREVDPLREMSAHREWSYVDRGRYGPQLERLHSLIDNVHVVIFEQMITDPRATLLGIHRFLGIEEREDTSLEHLNSSNRRPQRGARLLARALTRNVRRNTETVLGLRRGSLPW